MLVDGFRTVVTFALVPLIFLREREVHPPELDGGGPIDTTTMWNGGAVVAAPGPGVGGSGALGMRTQTPKSLMTLGKLTLTCQYDPWVYSQLFGVINVVQFVTTTFPDTATVAFNGWVNKFAPAPLKEGEFPLSEVEIWPTNTLTVPVGPRGRNDSPPALGPGNSLGMVVR